jgi:hypothetical protein
MCVSTSSPIPVLGLRRTLGVLLIMPCLLCGLALSSCAQQAAAPAEASGVVPGLAAPASHAIEAPVPLQGNDFTLRNPLGIPFAEQPVQVLLAQRASEGTNLVLDEAGRTIGQVQSDRRRLSVRAGFASDQKERRFRLVKGAATALAGLEHPVSLRTVAWTSEQTKAVGTTHSSGIASYYEISNGLCGVRVRQLRCRMAHCRA